MPDATGLMQVIDNTGNPYPAIRPRALQLLTTVIGNPVAANPFQPQTKVVRVCPSTDVQMGIGGITGSWVIGAGIFQDFIVYPGDVVQITAITDAGTCSIMEMR